MTPERWERVGEIYGEALALAPEERDSFLSRACGGDESLRREVESLLAAEEGAGDFMADGAMGDAARMLAGDDPPSIAGQRLNNYEVLSLVGRGGMGEVYKARDTRLGRTVAIKVLPAAFSSDRERLLRFEREARAASGLNHPNVCTIYEVGETAEGLRFAAMEYVEGITLRDLLRKRAMKVTEALGVAVQVASALAAAHSSGVIHRDVKPENIMLREDRLVKVLDFGLAKLIEGQPSGSEAPTRAQVRTRTGMVMGTVSYMSPEQARGLVVDARTDVWSLAVVLYEMVAGRTPFEGETNSDVIVSILEREPAPLVRLARDVPAELQRIITKALRKDSDERYQTIKDMGLDLRTLKKDLEFAERLERSAPPERSADGAIKTGGAQAVGVITGEEAAPADTAQSGRASGGSPSTAERQNAGDSARPSGRGKGRTILLLGTLVTVFLAAGAAFLLYRIAARDRTREGAGAVSQAVPVTTFPGYERQPSFSPDGNQIAFVWDGERDDNADIYVKLTGAEEPLRLTTNPAPDLNPVWSPDGRHIAFTREGEGGGIYLVPALGGTERRLMGIYPERPPFYKRSLSYSPGGEWLAVADKDSAAEPYSIYLFSVATGEKRRLTSPPAGSMGDESPAFSPDGKLLAFARMLAFGANDIYVVPVSGGEPKRLTFDEVMTAGLSWTGDGREIVFSSSRGGGIHHLWRVPASGGEPRRVDVFAHEVFDPVISRQGNRLAWTQQQDDFNIWRAELRGTPAQAASPMKLIASTMGDSNPQYSPDGEKIVFTSSRSGALEIWVCDREGKNPLQLTTFGAPNQTGSPRWSPDGRQITFDGMIKGNRDIYVVSAQGGKPRRLTTEISEDMRPGWSRDGRYIYFGSSRSGRLQIWKMPAEGGEAVQVTRQGGFEGFEDTEGKYFYYAKGRQEPGIWRVPVGGGEEQFVLDHHRAGYWPYWAVTRQGIYFATAETPSRPVVEFFSFATGEVRQVGTIEKQIVSYRPGFSASPDERWILYMQLDQRGSDIMLVEDFR